MAREVEFDALAPWFHGSPLALTELLVGSTITQDRALAKAFSHKPTLVSVDDQGIRHNGRRPGFLYRITEWVGRDDVTPHPDSPVPGTEWLTTRPLRVTLVEPTAPTPAELLSVDEEEGLRQRVQGQP